MATAPNTPVHDDEEPAVHDNHQLGSASDPHATNHNFRIVSRVPDPLQHVTPKGIAEGLFEAGLEVFVDEFGNPFARIPCNGDHHEVWPVSQKCRGFIGRLKSIMRDLAIESPSKRFVGAVVEVLVDHAEQGLKHRLENRVAVDGDALLIDLADSLWRAIRVTPQGWQIIQLAKPIFLRHPHQSAQVEPIPGGSVFEIFNFIPFDDPGERLLVLAWTVAALHADVGTPILTMVGPAGSLKSTRTRFLRSLIDPTSSELMGELERKELPLIMDQHAVPCFDNLGAFSRREADLFCRAVTGTAYQRRKLYSDQDSVFVKYRRAIILNSLELPSARSDFLDRCLIFNVPRVADYDSEFDRRHAFDRARPRILGALLDLLVKTLRVLPEIDSRSTFRMADFVRLGRAVSRAMGKAETDFDDAYRDSLYERFAETMVDEPLAQAAASLVANEPFEGTAADLLKRLEAIAKERRLRLEGTAWPSNTRWLTTRLTELVPVLASAGVRAMRTVRRNNGRYWRIEAADAPCATRPES